MVSEEEHPAVLRFTFHVSPFTDLENDARTLPGERCVLAHRGWAGEKRDFFSILIEAGAVIPH